MLRILQFLYNLRSFILFILLEVIAIWLLVENNSPQGAAFFNSSNSAVGSILETQSDIRDFFSLAEANEALVGENSRLLEQLKIRKVCVCVGPTRKLWRHTERMASSGAIL